MLSQIKLIRKMGRLIIDLALLPAGLVLIAGGLLYGWARRPSRIDKPRLSWQSTPIRSLAYMADAMRQAGYVSETAVTELYAIYRAENFDHVLVPPASCGHVLTHVWRSLLAYRFFAASLSRYDVFFLYFDGGVLRQTLMARCELSLLRLIGKKIVLLPYGSDAFVYDQIAEPVWRHGLMISYPKKGNEAQAIQDRLRRMVGQADVVVACLAHYSSLPRWDILPLTCYPVDTNALQPVPPKTVGSIRIAHAANHRGVKGTEYIMAAVDQLRAEGHDIVFDLIEGVDNDAALKRIAACDIFVDQLVLGYALAALEGMALGKVVVSPISGPAYDMFRLYSYLSECPIVSASQATISDVLRDLIRRRQEWPEIGERSRDYVLRRHSFAASAKMYSAILDKIWGGVDVDLINYYHPLLEKPRQDRRE